MGDEAMSERPDRLAEINRRVTADAPALIREEERRYAAEIEHVAGRIEARRGTKIVLLAGPSASGKTTTAFMLAEALATRGHTAYTVSLDDFFRPQNSCVDEEGERDFESVNALDLPLLRQTFAQLLETGSCEIPHFDFTTGGRAAETRHLRVEEGDVIIVEGIHALNPLITDSFPAGNPLKLYVNVSSRVYDAAGDVVLSKRDLRFVRRMIRDYHYRSSTVDNTFLLWDGVMHGEDAYLFPFRHRADIRINSFHAYEPCVFRDEAVSLLEDVDGDSVYYPKARDLIRNLRRFISLGANRVPEFSLLREFLS